MSTNISYMENKSWSVLCAIKEYYLSPLTNFVNQLTLLKNKRRHHIFTVAMFFAYSIKKTTVVQRS